MRRPGPWLLLPLLLLLASAGSAQDGGPEPTPAPVEPPRPLSARGEALLPTAVEAGRARAMARDAAWLGALHRLAVEALGGGPNPLRIDAAHPRYDLLAWLLGARSEEVEAPRGSLAVRLEAPPPEDLQAPPLPGSLERDVDGDGRLERLVAGADTRVSVFRGEQELASTPGLGSLEARTWPGAGSPFTRVRLTRLVRLEGAEPAGPGQVRLLVRLASREAAGGHYLGGAEERREVLLALPTGDPAPRVDVADPGAEGGRPSSRLPLRGRIHAPGGLQSVQLVLNGADLWRSPPGFQGEDLRLDLVVDLRPGPNVAVLTVLDRKGRKVEKTWTLAGPPPPARGQDRALVVGLAGPGSPESPGLVSAPRDAAAVRDALAARGFAVRTLLGAEATRAAVQEALEALGREGRPGDRVVLYLAGPSSLGLAAEGKLLLPWDASPEGPALSARDLGRWARRLPGVRLLVVLDTACRGPVAAGDPPWVEQTDFLQVLAGAGRLVLSTGDPSPEAREAGQEGLLTRALLQAWRGAADPFQAALEAYPAAVEAAASRAAELGEPPRLPLLREE